MEWEITFVLLIGLCILVCTDAATLVHPVIGVRPYSLSTFPNATVVFLSPLGKLRTSGERLLCGTPVTHVGLVWVDARGTPFLFHTDRTNGAHLEPLLPWCRTTLQGNNQVFVCRVGGGDPVEGGALEEALSPLLGMRYSFGFWKAVVQTWWPGVWEMPRPSDPSDRFCSELVAEVLGRVGVLAFSDTVTPRLMMPRDLWETHRVPTAPGRFMHPPEELFLSALPGSPQVELWH